jgi:ABC-type spermidine/putrescine transport system permease subunit II
MRKSRLRDAEALSPFMIGMLALSLAILFVPLAIIILLSFNTSPYGTFPFQFTLKWYGALFTDSGLLGPAWLSVELSFIVAISAAVLGTMAALWLDRRASRVAGTLFRVALLSAITVPWLILGLAMLLVMNAVGNDPALCRLHRGRTAECAGPRSGPCRAVLGCQPCDKLSARQRAVDPAVHPERNADFLHGLLQ